MKKLILILPFLFPIIMSSQQTKKPLDFSVYDSWNSINSYSISANGQFLYYEINPYIGDGKIAFFNVKTKSQIFFQRAYDAQISTNSNFIVFKVKPQLDTVRKLRLKKTKKDNLPKDSLYIFTFTNDILKFANLKSYDIPKESSDWVSFMLEMPQDTLNKSDKKKIADKSAPKVAEYHIINPITKKEFSFKNISESSVSRNGNLFAFVKLNNDSLLNSTLFVFDTKTQKLDSLFTFEGLITKVKVNNIGTQLAFLYSNDTIAEKIYSIFLYDIKTKINLKVADTLTPQLPFKWTASINGQIFFSRDDKRLFFGSALRPLPPPIDTLLDDEKVVLDLWSWNDKQLQPEQLVNKNMELKRTYLTEFIINDKKLILLADTVIQYIDLDLKATNKFFLGKNSIPYERQSSWDGSFSSDIYIINAQTGDKKLVVKKANEVSLSPDGNFLLYYKYEDSCWFVKNIINGETKDISKKINVPFYEEENDYPKLPGSYGIAAWAENSNFVLIYDKYDIWRINMDKNFSAQNITNSYGRQNKIKIQYMSLDPEEEYISEKQIMYLRGFNEINKHNSFYSLKTDKISNPVLLYEGAFSTNTWIKAKNSNEIVFRRQTFEEYPDIWLSETSMKKPEKISNINPQQKDYLWGSVDLVKWTTDEGKEEEGLLYKPENFDPNKKYPMIVYFYRLYSDNLFYHYAPRPSRSVINFTFYTSNDYLVFVPNIRYKVGYPGQSAYDYIVGGTKAMINKYSFIDENHLGIQGQSWGGYQVAYVITQTDMFAAASAGAPVSNMTSAYGAIRWESGMSRMFQYEQTQSRIGATLWEKPQSYIDNSPIFYVPNIKTPLLIRHDDADGAVPWYQGIELFVAMRRLNKPVWLLNYNGQPHNLEADSPDCKDLSIRMKQFFDYYLKNAPAPKWMIDGIPAIDKGKDFGYELLKN